MAPDYVPLPLFPLAAKRINKCRQSDSLLSTGRGGLCIYDALVYQQFRAVRINSTARASCYARRGFFGQASMR